MTIMLLAVEHKHGTDHWACDSEETAMQTLDTYVQEWWETEMEGAAVPEIREDRIAAYFEANPAAASGVLDTFAGE